MLGLIFGHSFWGALAKKDRTVSNILISDSAKKFAKCNQNLHFDHNGIAERACLGIIIN